MKIYSHIYSLRKLQNNQETIMISYAKYKTKLFILECSTRFSVLPELVQTSFSMKKKVLDNSNFSRNFFPLNIQDRTSLISR